MPCCPDDGAGARGRAPLRGGRSARHLEVAAVLDHHLPGVSYGLISALFLIFTLVITDFGIPKVIGGQFNVLATDAYKQVIGQQNFEMGAVVGFVLLAPAVLAFIVDRIIQKRQVALLTARAVPLLPKRNVSARDARLRLLRADRAHHPRRHRRRHLGVVHHLLAVQSVACRSSGTTSPSSNRTAGARTSARSRWRRWCRCSARRWCSPAPI